MKLLIFKWSLLFIVILAACSQATPSAEKKAETPATPTETPADVNTDKSTDADNKTITETPAAAPEDVSQDQESEKSIPATAKPANKVIPPGKSSRTPGTPEESGFTDITSLDPSVRIDIRYATANNFTKAQIYDCPLCLLRPDAAAAIAKAHKVLIQKGYGGLKMFDCYRPRPYQQRLWDKVPNPDYVTPPAKGSMHSRGAAVDLTIVDKNGKELNMGTEYDFFGEEAHYDYTKLPQSVLSNRRLLRSTLEAVGFQGIRTEWWHFSYRGKEYPLSDYVWKCK